MAKLKFLVVEDDLFYQTYVNDLLAETGVDIINAQDGEAGLSMAVEEQPHLIITDIEIPKIQGFVLFKMLRERAETKDIPVIMMSGKVEKALLDRHSRLATHAEGYLVKPFNGQVLIDMIREVVGEDFGYSEVMIDQESDGAHDVVQDPGDTNAAPEMSQFPDAHHDTKPFKHKITVLVVDDSKYICDMTGDFLEELDVRIETAFDGETGYKMASDLLPDLILLDVQMPNLNGFVVCEMLRKQEETKNIPIILMSAVVDDESFQRHSRLRYRADAYLQKPFMKSELHELVQRYTSLGDIAAVDVESKTGFFVPPEDFDEDAEGTTGRKAAGDPKLAEELKQVKARLQSKTQRETALVTELDSEKKARDQLEAELFELRKIVEGKEGALQDKLTLATQRFEEARSESERLVEENKGLQARLDEYASAEEAAENAEELKEKIRGMEEELNASLSRNEELEQAIRDTESGTELKAQLSELGAKLQEAGAAALDLENRNRLLEEELAALEEKGGAEVQGGGEGQERDELLKEIEGLKRDLAAATAAKSEIEDQAKALFETRAREDTGEVTRLREELERSIEENQDLVTRISEAESKVGWLDDIKEQLEKAQAESEALRKQLSGRSDETDAEVTTLRDKLSAAVKRAKSLEMENSNLAGSLEETEALLSSMEELQSHADELKKELEENRKLASIETEARKDLQAQLEKTRQVNADLEVKLEEARSSQKEGTKADGRLVELQTRLDNEKERLASAKTEIQSLQAQLKDYIEEETKVRKLAKDNKELREALKDARERLEILEKEKEESFGRADDDVPAGGRVSSEINNRLDQLENTLEKTVKEAQTILKEHRDRESALEESVDSLMRSLQEEKTAYRKDREAWSAREGELRDAFEDALRESRRLMGEEAARLYPMHIPRTSRPLEVVTRTSRYGLAVAAAATAILVFAGGYLLKSKVDRPSGQTAAQVQSVSSPAKPQSPYGRPPEPWIARSGPEETYEELWRRNTIQSVSDDMLIQATFHTRDELEAAIKYTAAKEGWTRERIEQSMADLGKTYNLSGSYYITVYSKNLKSGYPGYADNFERHIALRDPSGREVRAHLPGELEGSKFITSRVSAAGKEMNPIFLYEVGLTVAFSRRELTGNPEGLQLVLYDIGAVPMRVLTWDMSIMGSLS
ncbi:MAG: response regulator [bacterium]|nr:MAG: response regulator [bacterium]